MNIIMKVKTVIMLVVSLVMLLGFTVVFPATANAVDGAGVVPVSTGLFPEAQTTVVVNNTGQTIFVSQQRGQFRKIVLTPGAAVSLINTRDCPWFESVAFDYTTKVNPTASTDFMGVQTFITSSPWSVRVWPNSGVTTTDQSKQLRVTQDTPAVWNNLVVSYQGQQGAPGGVFTIIIS